MTLTPQRQLMPMRSRHVFAIPGLKCMTSHTRPGCNWASQLAAFPARFQGQEADPEAFQEITDTLVRGLREYLAARRVSARVEGVPLATIRDNVRQWEGILRTECEKGGITGVSLTLLGRERNWLSLVNYAIRGRGYVLWLRL